MLGAALPGGGGGGGGGNDDGPKTAAAADASYNLKVGIQLVKRAVTLENDQSFKEARDLYVEAADRLTQWKTTKNPLDRHTRSVHDKINDYRMRATNLTVTHRLPDFATVRGAAEFSIKYAGKFPTAKRTALRSRCQQMQALDQAKMEGHLLWNSATLEASTLTVSVYGLKLTDQHQAVVLRQPLHAIASFNCCEDEGLWYLFFVCGDPGNQQYSCEVCECALAADAAEICALVQGHLDEAFKKAKPLPNAVEERAMTPVDGNILSILADVDDHGRPVSVGDEAVWSEHFTAFAPPVSLSPLKDGPSVLGRPVIEEEEDPVFVEPAEPADAPADAPTNADANGELWSSNSIQVRLASQPLESPDADFRSPSPVMAWPPQKTGVNTTELVRAYMAELRQVLGHDELREFAILLKA